MQLGVNSEPQKIIDLHSNLAEQQLRYFLDQLRAQLSAGVSDANVTYIIEFLRKLQHRETQLSTFTSTEHLQLQKCV